MAAPSRAAQQSQTREKHRSPAVAGPTKDAILDIAERLFAERGIASVSLREVARNARVSPASITYHFGSKEEVLTAVVRRRYEALREPRSASLDRAIATAGDGVSVRQILDAMFRSWLEFTASDEPGWRNYSKVMGSILIEPMVAEIIESLSGAWERTTIEALTRACPDADEETVLRALTLSLGTSYFFFSTAPKLDLISHGRFHAADLERAYPAFLNFVTAGFEAAIASDATVGATHRRHPESGGPSISSEGQKAGPARPAALPSNGIAADPAHASTSPPPRSTVSVPRHRARAEPS